MANEPKKEPKTVADSLATTPIAAKLKAEPGWRAVLLVPHGPELGEGLQMVAISVKAVKHWALDAPTIVPGTPDKAFIMRFMGLFDGFAPSLPMRLWPIDSETGKRLSEGLHRLVPPSDETDEQLVEAAKLWCAEIVEKNKKPEEPVTQS